MTIKWEIPAMVPRTQRQRRHESAETTTFRGFRAELRIDDERGEPLARMTIAGNAAIVSEAIKWTADAFREDQER